MFKQISIIIILYFALNLYLLDKSPIPTPDETWFANDAYSLTGREKLSSYPFDFRLPVIDKSSQIAYGPVYPLILSIPLRFFPYGLTTTRLTSVFLGALTILVLFSLSKSLFRNSILAFLSAFLLSISSSFLNIVRFVRPEILVILFTCLSYLFYFRKKYFFTGLFISLGIFTHYLIGIIPALVVILHFLANNNIFKNKKNILLLILPSVLFSILWAFILNQQNLNLNEVLRVVISTRTAPNFQLITSFFDWQIPKKISFIVYFLSFFVLIILSNKKDPAIKKFCLLNFLITFIIFAFGNSRVYEDILTIPAILCVLALSRTKYLFPIFLSLLLITNLFVQIFILFSPLTPYYSYGQIFSKNIAQNSKVFLKQTNPDPYLYLAEKRPDLKLDYLQVIDSKNYQNSLSKADYIITHGYDMVFFEDYKKTHLPQDYPFDLTLTKFLETNESKIQKVADIKTSYIYNIVVLKVSKPANSK